MTEHTPDTLPAWLAQRFGPRGPDWDALGDDDRSYWAHQAAAVRRAVARDGFKNPDAAPSLADQALINYAAGHRNVTADSLAPYLAAVRAEAAAEAIAERDRARTAAVALNRTAPDLGPKSSS